jgi:hypothetical protein
VSQNRGLDRRAVDRFGTGSARTGESVFPQELPVLDIPKSRKEPKVDFSSREQFELHVHNCFTKIFDGLMKMDSVIKVSAEKEEASGRSGPMCDLRDQIEEVILHSHLAWQYHRLSRSLASSDTWDRVEGNKAE